MYFYTPWVYGNYFRRGAKIDKKLKFLEAAGIFTSRTLSRLNTIRNRMEHLYEIPKVSDLEAYFDLVTAFVSVLERTMVLTQGTLLEFDIIKGNEPYEESYNTTVPKYHFVMNYDYEKLNITVDWNVEEDTRNLIADSNDIHEFAYFLRVFILLAQKEAFASDEYLISQL